jgi:hypothetical protein
MLVLQEVPASRIEDDINNKSERPNILVWSVIQPVLNYGVFLF